MQALFSDALDFFTFPKPSATPAYPPLHPATFVVRDEAPQVHNERREGATGVYDEDSPAFAGTSTSQGVDLGGVEDGQATVADDSRFEWAVSGDEEADSDDETSSADSDAENSSTDPSHHVVLFDGDATFPSKAKFFSEAKKRIYRSYGVTAWIERGSDYYSSIRCSRCANGCKYSIRIERKAVNEVWRLCAERCEWQHNHDMEGDEEERASWSSSDEEDEAELEANEEPRAKLRSRPVAQDEQSKSSRGTSVWRQKPTGTGKPWSASTSSATMKKLVKERGEIFQLQRNRAKSAARQTSSAAIVKRHLAQFSDLNAAPQNAFNHFSRFAEENQMPPFPLTPALIALWLFDKCSQADGHPKTYTQALIAMARLHALADEWRTQPSYAPLLKYDPDFTAVKEFLVERRHLSTAKVRGKKKATALKPAPTARKPKGQGAEAEGSARGGRTGTSRLSGRNVVVPGLPSAADSFASSTNVFQAYVKALVPVYGISVTQFPVHSSLVHIKCNRHHARYSDHPDGNCSWHAVVKRDSETKRWRVDFDESHFEHSHGPCKEILRDPTFRPTVRNPDAREALGMPPLDGSVGAKVQDKGETSTKGKGEKEKGKEKKREREKERNANERKAGTLKSKGKERTCDISPPSKKRRLPEDTTREPPPPAASISPAPSDHAYPQPQAGPSMFHTARAYQPPTFTQAPQYPHPTPAPQPAANYVPSLNPLPTSDVSAFLHGLHSSLEPLAPHFIATGFTTIDALASLALLDPAMIDHTLAHMRARAEAASMQSQHAPAPPSVIQLRLLAKSLKEAGRA